jgi:hypothetical protein
VPGEGKFTGRNYTTFVEHFYGLLRFLKILYLIEPAFHQKPPGQAEEDDKELLYLCLCRNINEAGKDLIYDLGLDGVEAWITFKAKFGRIPFGVTLDNYLRHASTAWEGGDNESFNKFLAEWDFRDKELRRGGVELTTWQDALLLSAMVPQAYLVKFRSLVAKDVQLLNRSDIVEGVRAYIGAH